MAAQCKHSQTLMAAHCEQLLMQTFLRILRNSTIISYPRREETEENTKIGWLQKSSNGCRFNKIEKQRRIGTMGTLPGVSDPNENFDENSLTFVTTLWMAATACWMAASVRWMAATIS